MSFFAFLNSETVDHQDKNPWTTLSALEAYDNQWITCTEFKVINPAGKEGIYGKVHFKNKAIGIVPVDEEGNTYLVGQYRFVLNEWSWEIPEGGCPASELALEAAKRELKEETGLTASRWKLIQRSHISNSVSDEEGFVFLAEGLASGIRELEETEAGMKLWKLPFTEALAMVLDGKITDSLSVMGIMKAGRLLGV